MKSRAGGRGEGGEGESGQSCRDGGSGDSIVLEKVRRGQRGLCLHEHSCITVMAMTDRSDSVLISVEVSRVKNDSRKWRGGGRQSDWK